jgi:hypothetical protein
VERGAGLVEGEQYQLPLQAGRTAPLALQGWVSQETARRVLALGGHDLDALTAAAQRRGFRAVPTGVQATSSIRSTTGRQQTANVVGLLRGTGDEVVTYSAHYDHLGIGIPVDGDSIYSGALDNASGVAVMLQAAEAWAALGERPARSILFIATAAEESGLLGAEYYVQNPLFPVERTVANLNIDMTHFLGSDPRHRAARRRPLHPRRRPRRRARAARDARHRRPAPGGRDLLPQRPLPLRPRRHPRALLQERRPRSRAGPPGWGAERLREFDELHYHRPSDVFREDFDFRGAERLTEIAFRLGHRIANAPAPRSGSRGASSSAR